MNELPYEIGKKNRNRKNFLLENPFHKHRSKFRCEDLSSEIRGSMHKKVQFGPSLVRYNEPGLAVQSDPNQGSPDTFAVVSRFLQTNKQNPAKTRELMEVQILYFNF